MRVVAYQGDRLLIETSVDESGMAYGYVADSAYTPLTAEKALITYLARGYWTPMPEGQVVKSLDLNSGEATSEPSIVAAAGDAQWTERS